MKQAVLDILKRYRNDNGIIITNKPKVLSVFAVSCVHRAFDPRTAERMIVLSRCPDVKITLHCKYGDALIDRARSMVASDFLLNRKDDILLFIDDDIIFNPIDAVRMCKSMSENNLDILGGAYMAKRANKPFLVIKTLDNNPIVFGEQGAIEEVRYVSTGFMAISRKVLEKMAETLPLCHPDDLKFYPFFQPYPKEVDGKWLYLSEDWSFCQRARDLDFKIWVDTTIKLGHMGQYLYDWDDLNRPPKEVLKDFTYNETLNPEPDLTGNPAKVSEAVLQTAAIKET